MAGPAPIRIRIGASLESSVAKTFDDVAARARKSAETTQRVSTRAARETSASVQQEYNRQLAALNKAAAAQDKLWARNAANAQKAAAQKARAEEKAAQAAEKAAIREIAIRERAALRKAAAEKRAADATIREQERVTRAQERAEQRADTASRRSAQSRIDRFADRAGFLASRFTTPYAPITSIAKRTASDLLRGAGVNFDIASAVSRGVEAESLATKIANQGYVPGGDGIQAVRQSGSVISKEVGDIATKYGMARASGLQGVEAFAGKTGDLATARAILEDMARLALATGTEFGDMIDAAGDVSSKLGDPAKTLAEAQQRAQAVTAVMRVMAGQGKLGAVEIKDLAVQMSRVAGSAADFEGDRGQNIIKLGAVAQLSRMGTATSAADAARSVAALSNTFRKNARIKAFDKAGVQIFADEGRTKIRDPFEIIKDALVKTNGDIPKLNSMFMDTLGAKAVSTLGATYKDAGGGQAGLDAIDKLVKRLTKDAAVGDAEVTESIKREMETTARKAQQFQNQLDEIVSEMHGKVMPALVKLAPDALAAANALSKFVQWTAENPFSGLGVVFAAMVVRAGIDAAISSAVTAIMARAGAAIMARLAVAGWANAAYLAPGAVAPLATGGAATGALGLGAGAAGAGLLGKFLAPTVRGMSVGGLGGAGIGLAAYIAYQVADGQNERLKKTTGGMGWLDIASDVWDGFKTGGETDPRKIVDNYQNQKAKEEAVAAGRLAPDGRPRFSMADDPLFADLLNQQSKTTDATDAMVSQLKNGVLKVEVISPIKLDAPLELPPRRDQ